MKRASKQTIRVRLSHLKMATESMRDIESPIFRLDIHRFPNLQPISISLSTHISPEADFKIFSMIVLKIQGVHIPRELISINSLFGKLPHLPKDYLLSRAIFCTKPSKTLNLEFASGAKQNAAYPEQLPKDRYSLSKIPSKYFHIISTGRCN